MEYLLDTNAVIALLENPEGALSRRLHRYAPADFGLPSLVLHELFYGAFRSQRRDRNLATVEALQFEVVPFEQEDARHAGEIRANLVAAGQPIGAYDFLIAGQARARDLTLITHNLKEFRRVEGLRFENWQDP